MKNTHSELRDLKDLQIKIDGGSHSHIFYRRISDSFTSPCLNKSVLVDLQEISFTTVRFWPCKTGIYISIQPDSRDGHRDLIRFFLRVHGVKVDCPIASL